MKFNFSQLSSALALASLITLTACGGGGGGGGSSKITPPPATGGDGDDVKWTQGQYDPWSDFYQKCEADGTGSTLEEKLFVRSYSDDTYLWYNELTDENPDNFSTVIDYFDQLKTDARTPSGKLKDEFHFTYPTDEWERLTTSGESYGYGFNFKIDNTEPRTIIVSYTEDNTPAADTNVIRGAKILEVDGVNVADAADQQSIDVLNAGLFPSENGKETTFVIQDLGSDAQREVVMTAQTIVSDPVPIVQTIEQGAKKVGYIVFNDHNRPSESGLFDAINQLETENIDDLVIDLRYNGGGLLYVASALGYMVAGEQTENKTFEQMIFNDKHPDINPLTGQALSPTPFVSTAQGYREDLLPEGTELPTLNLSRVFVLTSDNTCSASEAFMNSMLGIDVEVIQIGSGTCGKPYGFYGTDNCETTYFTVQFKGVNEKGFGDYADGFTPSNTPVLETDIQGCEVADDLTNALGNAQEGMLSTAIYYAENGECPMVATHAPAKFARSVKSQLSEYQIEDKRIATRLLNNRIMTK